jgi:hypothetical protein
MFLAKNLPVIFAKISSIIVNEAIGFFGFSGTKPRQDAAIAFVFSRLSAGNRELERPGEPAQPQAARP